MQPIIRPIHALIAALHVFCMKHMNDTTTYGSHRYNQIFRHLTPYIPILVNSITIRILHTTGLRMYLYQVVSIEIILFRCTKNSYTLPAVHLHVVLDPTNPIFRCETSYLRLFQFLRPITQPHLVTNLTTKF